LSDCFPFPILHIIQKKDRNNKHRKLHKSRCPPKI
jgi:hypothetical protein